MDAVVAGVVNKVMEEVNKKLVEEYNIFFYFSSVWAKI